MNRNTAAGPEPLVEAIQLTRTFGARHAVAEVNLSVVAGECVAVFGPNGSGKTTLLRLLAGLLRPTRGQALIAGARPSSRDMVVRRPALIAHPTMLYEALSARENLLFSAGLFGLADRERAVADSLAAVGAQAYMDTPIRSLSRGMQQRVTVARALLPAPQVLLADEPFTALDEEGVSAVQRAMRAVLERGGAIVLVTHDAANARMIATRSVTMSAGRLSA